MTVANFNCITRKPSEVEELLREVISRKAATVMAIGWDQDGGFFFQSSTADGGEALWLLEVAKKELMK